MHIHTWTHTHTEHLDACLILSEDKQENCPAPVSCWDHGTPDSGDQEPPYAVWYLDLDKTATWELSKKMKSQ